MVPRIVQLFLNAAHDITGMRILERRNPLFDGITTGALIGVNFYFVANGQSAKPEPLRILQLDIPASVH